jgi:hypothetical protein
MRQSFQSNSSSTTAASSGRRRPLQTWANYVSLVGKLQCCNRWGANMKRLTNIQLVSAAQKKNVSRLLHRRHLKGHSLPYPSKSIVLIINPRVGLTVVTSSPMIRLTMVVLPALSRPLVFSPHQRTWTRRSHRGRRGALTASGLSSPYPSAWPFSV